MKLLKKGIVLFLVGLIGISVVGCSNKQNQIVAEKLKDDTVIATVGDKEIKKTALNQQLVYLETLMQWKYGEDYTNNKEAMAYYKEQKRLLVDYLVEVQVIIAQAEALGVEVTEQEVLDGLEVLKADYETEEAFEKALTMSGMSLDELKTMLKEDLMMNKVIAASTEGLSVSDEEAQTYYDGNQLQFTRQPGAVMSHILVKTEEEAKEIKAKYEKGTSFEELAEEYSIDETKEQGGLIGSVTYDSTEYEADFLAAAKLLEEGEVSKPVKTKAGWHLIKVEDVVKEETLIPFDKLKTDIKAYLLTQKQNEEIEKKLAVWKSEIEIVIKEDLI